jgi:predicted Na+-dependent transporter
MEAFSAALRLLAGAATFAVMFGGALRLQPEMLQRLKQNPRLFVRTLVVIWVAIPLFTALVILILRVRGQSATLLLLMSVCPGIPLLLASARNVRGRMATAFAALVLMAATEPIMIPFWTRMLTRFLPVDLTVQPKHILDVLLPTVFLPIALGFLARDLSVGTGILGRISDLVYVVGIVASIVAILYQGLPILPQVPIRAMIAVFVITVGDAMLGYWAGGPHLEDRKAVATAAALGNPALALAVVEASYPEFQAVVLVAVYLLIRGIVMLPVEQVLKKWSRWIGEAR